MGLMDKQTQQAFALGGLNDEGGEIDEASGNRVPIGGTKEGVRDDIEINISEGEFVFPADVVRYHGLDKMMALRQEAKMGLKQMERMGQMGNSEEATMPDDLPFEMADLIVVGGKGEPMEFANGGFVPKMETLETAPVPTMGGGTSTGTQTPIIYEDFMKPPVVTMQEYRDANGNSIIITSVNGVATTPIPEGYTLYTPPANTAPTTTQAAIQTVNINSYRPSGDSEGPEPQPDQPAPDYKNMNDNEFFSYMAEQNGFGAKAGNAAGLAIATMIGGPVGLLVSALMRNDKNNQMANMKSRIDRMDDGPAKTKALAAYKEYGGETDPKKKQGLFASITNFVTGLVTPVANALGINQEDAAKVAQNAAVTEVSGTAAYDEKVKQARANIISPAQSVTPTADQTRPQLRPDQFPTVQETISKYPKGNVVPNQIASPLGNVLSAEANQGMVPAPASISVAARSPTDFQYDAQNKALISGRIADQNFTNDRNAFIKANNQAKQIEQNAEQIRANAARERSLTMPGGSDQSVSKSKIKAGKPVGAAPSPDDFKELSTGPQTDAGRRIAQSSGQNFVGGDFQTAGLVGDTIGAINKFGAEKLGGIDPSQSEDSVVKQLQDNVYTATPSITQAPVAPTSETRRQNNQTNLPAATVTQQAPVVDFATPMDTPTYGTSLKRSPTDFQYAELDPRDTVNLTGTGVDAQMTAAIPPQQGLISKQMEGMGSPLSPVTSPIGLNVEPRARSMYEYPVQETAPKETPAQARAREAAAQRARIQTRNKEIAAATSKIPARILNSKQTQDAIKAGYTGSTTGGYAIGKISGSDGNEAGVVQKADGKVTKVRDLEGYEGLKGTQRGAMTVFSDAEGTKFVKSTFGKKTKLNGDEYTGPGITQADKGGAAATATAQQITKNNVRYNVKDETRDSSGGGGESYSAPADPPGNTGGFTSITDMFDGGGPGESAEEERERGGGDGGSSRVICTELYKQGKLDRELYRMDVIYTAKHLSPITVRGYHYWAVPMVVKMRSSTLLTNVFEYLTIARAKEIAHIVKPQEYKKRSVLGYIIKNVGEAICYSIGLFTDQKDWTVLYNKGIVK